MGKNLQRPVTPPTRLPGGYDVALKFGNNAVEYMLEMAQTYGDIIHYSVAPLHIYQLNNPDYIKEVLVTQQRNFGKGLSVKVLKQLLGDGLLTTEGAPHLAQRRLLQPAFHKKTIAGFAQTMVDYSQQRSQKWQTGATVDINQEMKAITLPIVAKTLFSMELQDQPAFAHAFTVLQKWSRRTLLPPALGTLFGKLPLPLTLRFRKARRYLDEQIYQMLRERRAAVDSSEKADLMTLLLHTPASENGLAGLSDQHIRDELLTFFLAGDETTSTALTWAWYLLSQHPEVESRLHAELDTVLGGRLPTLADVPNLVYTEKVLKEVLRLFPPAYILTRTALTDCVIGDYTIPAGSVVIVSPYTIQRDARYYRDPLRFDPDRWTAEFQADLAKFTYLPFGLGARRCIGEEFARLESILVLATLAQNWQAQLLPGHQVQLAPKLVLLPKTAMPMILTQRRPTAPGNAAPTASSLAKNGS